METIFFECFVIFILTIINGFLAMAEAAVISGRKSKLQSLAESGNRSAKIALKLATDPNQLLSTVQIGITLIGIIAGVYGGATLSLHLEQYLLSLEVPEELSESMALSIVVGSITFLSIVLGELVPKRVALVYSENVAILIAPVLYLMTKICKPLVYFLNLSSSAVLKILKLDQKIINNFSEDELKIMINESVESGAVKGQERDIIIRVLKLGDRTVNSLMTPRTQINYLRLQDSTIEIIEKVSSSAHTWYPIIKDSLDDVIGVVSARSIWNSYATNKQIDLLAILESPIYFPETANILQLLTQFKTNKNTFSLVLDEHGGIAGLITLSDLMVAILGAASIDTMINEEIVQREDSSWLVPGSYPYDEFCLFFNIKNSSNELQFTTVAGYMLYIFKKIPEVGQSIALENYKFEIVDLDGNRIDKIIVSNAENHTN